MLMTTPGGTLSVTRSNSIVVAVFRRPRTSVPPGRLLLLRAWKIRTDLVMSTEVVKVTVWMPVALLIAVPDCTTWITAADACVAGTPMSKTAQTASNRARPWRTRPRFAYGPRSAQHTLTYGVSFSNNTAREATSPGTKRLKCNGIRKRPLGFSPRSVAQSARLRALDVSGHRHVVSLRRSKWSGEPAAAA